MAEPRQIRSDFADKIMSADIQPKAYEHIEKENGYVHNNYIRVLCDENKLGKHKRDYVSVGCRDLDDHAIQGNMIDVIQENLQYMNGNMHVTSKKILVVELGNRFITSDTLGPQAANEIPVTARLHEHEDPVYLKGIRDAAVLQPDVVGRIDLGPLSIVRSVAQNYWLDLVIAVDALAIHNIAKINRIVQTDNTGIQSGSDIGNHRMSLCEKSLHVPVIVTGAAATTSIGAILREALEVSGEEKQHILQKIQDSSYLSPAVTPKSMGDELKYLVYIVSESPNHFLRPNCEQL